MLKNLHFKEQGEQDNFLENKLLTLSQTKNLHISNINYIKNIFLS